MDFFTLKCLISALLTITNAIRTLTKCTVYTVTSRNGSNNQWLRQILLASKCPDFTALADLWTMQPHSLEVLTSVQIHISSSPQGPSTGLSAVFQGVTDLITHNSLQYKCDIIELILHLYNNSFILMLLESCWIEMIFNHIMIHIYFEVYTVEVIGMHFIIVVFRPVNQWFIFALQSQAYAELTLWQWTRHG